LSIQNMQTTTAGAAAKGSVVTVDFSDYADGNMPAGWTVTYPSGAGTSTIGIVSGNAQWRNTNNADRTAKILYNTATDTDYQIIRGTMSMAPQEAIGGGTPRFYAIGRVGNSGNNYVWCRGWCDGWFQYKGDIGYCVNGTEYSWATNISLTWSLDMTFVIGVGTSGRTYQVWSGNTLVYEHEEVGTSSSLGSGYRQYGSIAEIKSGTFGPRHGGKIAGISVADNEPPTFVGSYARMYRTSTTKVSLPASGPTALPSSFFPSAVESPDIDAVTVDGTFEVTESKPYLITARIERGTTMFSFGTLVLQRKPSGGSWADAQWGQDIYMGHGSNGIDGHWVQYLESGDQVRLATNNSGGASTSLLGDANGVKTYFTITGAG
jgi:hypothetical protein